VTTALAGALVLVRGRPYSGLPRSGYGWVATELLISEAEVAGTQTAQRLADLASSAGDWTLALWAAERGLIADPISEASTSSYYGARPPPGSPIGWRKGGETSCVATAPPTRKYPPGSSP
jgi:hypothetical protein